ADGDGPVGLVGGGDPVGTAEGTPLEEAEAPVEGGGAVVELRLVELRAEVVVVEDEPDAEGPQGEGQRPEDVRRVAGLEDVEAITPEGPQGEPGGSDEGVGVLPEERRLSGTGGRRAVLVEGDPLDDLLAGVAGASGAHHRHPVAGGRQGTALQPHPTVEGDRQVLDDDVGPRRPRYHATPW